ncbi:sensor histidine kinase [Peptostreptococcus equinus]|uniref:histidine kinase n=1 Tax=Peptostreptococcus equinus TaxID=3003601 RepID=A0ABY7JUG7_9FIRM|nr:HAMP domain-containing sensor histidine kinase [Peptostreptococcus sp. CBA3647]WAW15738.1 HAMP domain-containing sensor histidine kinase [Peptostreptococcus sp. CBA3647]
MKLHFGGLRKKVLKNFIFIITLVVISFELLLSIFVTRYYYTSIQQLLISQGQYINAIYNSQTNENVNFNIKAQSIVENQNLSQNSKIAINIIDRNKNTVIDQYGFKIKQAMHYIDVQKALQNSSEIIPFTYAEDVTDEKVMSIAVPIKVNGIVEGAARFSVSLEYIDKEIFQMVAYLILVGILILLSSIGLSLKFADSIIGPLTELKIFSNMLSKGNYNIKMNKERISDDEIGDLARTFENMAQEIKKSEKLKDEFISSISHELRTPLTSINGWSETLRLDGISKEEQDLGLNIIQEEAQRLIKLVEELLDFSRLSSDRIKLNIEELNVENLVVSVVNQLRSMAVDKNIRLSFEFLNQNMKIIYADKNRLRQVLINLIQNSIKFTPEQGIIVVKVDQDDFSTKFSVKDTGVGIEEKNLSNVSKKFFQEDFHKSGSGLGLAISDEIVKLHGGSMKINSKKNVGTDITFSVRNDSRK